uniref:Uncharacterized protein n=1 Tax=Rhizophora mucronata TaxID=61149 RepID=A0A2P2N935_RHIMU
MFVSFNFLVGYLHLSHAVLSKLISICQYVTRLNLLVRNVLHM